MLRLKAAGGRAHGDRTRKPHNRDRPSRAVPAPEANAEIQANLEQHRRRMITHSNAKSKSEKFPPPHQDGALGYTVGSPNHINTSFDPPDVPYSSVFPYQKGQPVSTWSGPLAKGVAIDNPRRKKQGTNRLSSKLVSISKEAQRVKNN